MPDKVCNKTTALRLALFLDRAFLTVTTVNGVLTTPGTQNMKTLYFDFCLDLDLTRDLNLIMLSIE